MSSEVFLGIAIGIVAVVLVVLSVYAVNIWVKTREAESPKNTKCGSDRAYSLEEDGANGSDTVDLSWPLDVPNVNVYQLIVDRIARAKAPLQRGWSDVSDG